jgi:hypothetical protein
MVGTHMDNSLALENEELPPDKCGGPTVLEAHIDFLLEEELSVNPGFFRSFIEAAGHRGTQPQIERVEHSVSDQYGEADLVVVYTEAANAGNRIAILIEDKIRARFQPRQADRYRERGGLGNGREWDRYWTCLVAPASYIKLGHGFDTAVTLEQIKGWFDAAQPERRAFKVNVVDRAIEKAASTGVQKVDPVMTAFRASYFALFEEFFKDQRQDVQMRPPAPTYRGDYWFEIRSRLLPKGAYINHKSPPGFVDLTFPHTEAALLMPVEPYLEAGMSLEQTGKSAAIRLEVSKIGRFNDFDLERGRVAEGLAAVRRLLNFYTREHGRLDPVLKNGRTRVLP